MVNTETALKLIQECLSDERPSFARMVRSYYWALVEITAMNGNGCAISSESIARRSFVNRRDQKRVRDFLCELQLLDAKRRKHSGGCCETLYYQLLNPPL